MSRTLVIAEAGVNHNGDLNLAFKLIEAAKKAGADIVKFQSFKAENLVNKSASKAEYQLANTSSDESQYKMLKKLELDKRAHLKLLEHCKKTGIEFLSSPFDADSAELLHQLELKIFKIPSGEINNYPFLVKLGKYNKKVILSTGMSTIGEIEAAIETLVTNGTNRDNITILHCNTEYPTPYKDVNLSAMITMRHAFKLNVGYSDHTSGNEVPIAAVARGASIIEKHFTLDRDMPGPDHRASLEPAELKQMISAIRNIELAMGDGIKRPSLSELKNISVVRKSIACRKAIKKGDTFSEENISTMRPGDGISPMLWDDLIGRKSSRDYKIGEKIEF